MLNTYGTCQVACPFNFIKFFQLNTFGTCILKSFAVFLGRFCILYILIGFAWLLEYRIGTLSCIFDGFLYHALTAYKADFPIEHLIHFDEFFEKGLQLGYPCHKSQSKKMQFDSEVTKAAK